MSIDASIDTRPLRSRFAGSVIAPGDSGWDEARGAFNLALDQRPALIAIAQDARDVAAVVRFAGERGLRVAPQATGHNAAPLGDLGTTILLKTSAMQGFSIDAEARRARVEAGVKWGPVCDAASAHGLAPLSGSSRDVGVVGYSLGGGLGWLGRKHGLACNAITAIELVTADGALVRADQEHEPDLFWALRGAGANVGIVTAIEFELFPAPQIYAGSLFFPFERAAEVMHAWRAWSATAPDAVTSTAKLLQLPPLEELPEPLRGRSFALVQAAFLGSEADGAALLEPLRALGPLMDTFAMVEPAALGYLAMDPEDPMPYRAVSQVLGELPREGFDTLLTAAGPGSGSTLMVVELRQLGGALGRTHDSHGARDMIEGSYLAFATSALMDPAAAPALEQELERVRRSLAMYEVGQYLNFAERPIELERAFDAPSLARLRALRSQV
ncbi:MAG TPA: FAD-binding oxidoreductase, partial [Conexibacter sp.]|nr:FAD-binding oxidoreductase [Conexibacter sp.]